MGSKAEQLLLGVATLSRVMVASFGCGCAGAIGQVGGEASSTQRSLVADLAGYRAAMGY